MRRGARPARDVAARRQRRFGGVLVEFSVSMVVLWLIIAATLDFGRAFAASHVLQSAARSAARELALDDTVAWDASFDDALAGIFDPDYLVVDTDCLEQRAGAAGNTPETELVAILGQRNLTLNLMLRPLMIFEHVAVQGVERHFLRYPGALLDTGQTPDPTKPCATRYTVGIAEVDEQQSRVTFHSVVEEIEPDVFRLGGAQTGALPVGTVALRLLYPFQAAALSGWEMVGGFQKPVDAAVASDYVVEATAVGGTILPGLDARGADGGPQAYALRGSGDPIPVYGGSLGLGVQGVLGRDVRPYRKVLTAQAIAPREVIGGGS